MKILATFENDKHGQTQKKNCNYWTMYINEYNKTNHDFSEQNQMFEKKYFFSF